MNGQLARCAEKDRACAYDIDIGVTRRQALILQLNMAREQLSNCKNVMLALQYGSITDATELLARLRLGEDVDELPSVVSQRRSTFEHRIGHSADVDDTGTRQ